ncbi:hypothetical protein ACHZ97_08380 [Lysobacter soli]|uniref:hypothetical protein n=1 Tax=Lysobacter soli TaxID=453783 RepID=UPI0037C781C1
MTEAVLAWQIFIFASIGLAGRWRGWAIAFWGVWTIVQVGAIPLSILQFGTIALAAALFRSSARVEQDLAVDTSRQSCSGEVQPPPPQGESPLAAGLSQANGVLRTWEQRIEASRQEWQFQQAAKRYIKTEGFSCALEERVMKEALARDQQLTQELQTELAKDSVLAKLYCAALARYGTPNTVQSRQTAERAALDAARSTRQTLDTIIDSGPDFKRHYFDALKKGAESVEAHSASDRLTQPLASLPVAISSIAAPLVGHQPVACVTRNTFKRVGMGLSPAGASLDAVFAYIYRKSLAPILNQTEAKSLYVLRCLFEGKADELAVPEKTVSPSYVFSVAPPKYHVSVNCEYLTSDFINYLVPPEIKAQGAERVRAFQQLCEENKTLLKDRPDAFWAHVGAQFGISSQPRRVQYTNSGVHELAQGLDLNELQLRIDDAIAEAESMIAPGVNGGVVANNRYAPNPKRVLASIDDPLARELVQKFFELKRDLLGLLFEFYRRESGNADLFLPVALLESAGLAPCCGCSKPPRTHRAEAGRIGDNLISPDRQQPGQPRPYG